MKKLISLLLLINIISSCAYMASVSQTSIPKDRSKKVSAKVENNIIFLFNFSNEYVESIPNQLISQCPNGSVKGILTKDENITYFPIVFHKSVITAEGYCVNNRKKKFKKRRKNYRDKR